MGHRLRDPLIPGERLKEMRVAHGLSVDELLSRVAALPERVPIKRGRYIGLEGDRTSPTFSDVVVLAKALGISISELIGRDLGEELSARTIARDGLSIVEEELVKLFREMKNPVAQLDLLQKAHQGTKSHVFFNDPETSRAFLQTELDLARRNESDYQSLPGITDVLQRLVASLEGDEGEGRQVGAKNERRKKNPDRLRKSK
ncbi:MAG: XRE family transcriptional regulator [Myxococcales bacterium]|nr:MAG: XRE family transcriptional regulator [Myxococcales bacterium]